MLKTLLGIDVKGYSIHRTCGILGWIEAYVGMVKAQNRGTLHLHMIMWLQNTPGADELQAKYSSPDFRETVRKCIEANIHAHLPGMDEQGIKVME